MTGQSDYTKAVIEVVVLHTGYPEDFIELDQDLEGELGIDTVKQAEIMAEIRQRFALPVDEDFILSDYPTLNHMIHYIQMMKGETNQTETSQSTPSTKIVQAFSPPLSNPTELSTQAQPSPGQGQPSSGQRVIHDALIEVVVKHTGYPEDFIEMDQDLEGELGIDTVKQAEIMVDIRERFALPVDEDFLLSDHPTLNHFAAYILKMKGENNAHELNSGIEEHAEDGIETPDMGGEGQPTSFASLGTRRWQVEVEECSGIPALLDLEGTAVVTIDGWGIAEALCERLEERGLNTCLIGFESGIRDASEQQERGRTVYRADPNSSEHILWIADKVGALPLCSLIHLGSLKVASATIDEDSNPSSQIALSAHSWFDLLQSLGHRLQEGKSGLVASVTSLDGRHGNRGERFNAIQCAASGVTKSYSFERTDLRCRALDIHPELLFEPEIAAKQIDSDLFERGGEVEIGLDRDGRRWALVAFAENVVDEPLPLSATDQWIVSGGGSGVTAASIVGLAQASAHSKAHFILLGRSNLIETTRDWVSWSEAELNEEKNALRQRLIQASSDGKVTMVQWNTAWQKFTRSRDVYATISAIEATGNSAEYQSIDVMDYEALASFGAQLDSPITGIVHGAGLEDSKLVVDKSRTMFDKVVRVKVDGWRALLGAVRASGREYPRFACCFTSVAGRFGNGGQTDYAAANSVLDAEMARLTATGHCRAVAIGWTGWRDVGMATRGSIEAVFEAAGIETLGIEDGVKIFVDEVLRGGKRRVLGCGSLGLMDRFNSFREAPLKLPAELASQMADPSRFPFINKITEFVPNQSMISQCVLSVAEHPFLADHAIEGIPYHPGVMAMEMFAQNALLLKPDAALAGFEAVQFGLPIKLMKGPMLVRTHAKIIEEGDMIKVQCSIVSDLMNSKGEIFGQREHHTGIVRLVAQRDDLRDFFATELQSIPPIGTPASGPLLQHPSFIYLRYFHGARFQSHGGVLRGVGDNNHPGLDGIALMRHQLPVVDQFALEQNGEDVLLESLPMLIEAGFQNAGLVAMESLGLSSLPVGIEWSTMLRVPEKDEQLRLRSIMTASFDDGMTMHDVLVVGDEDAPVLALKGLSLKAMAPIAEDQRFSFER